MFKTYVKAARITPQCTYENFKKFLEALGNSFRDVTNHKNWEVKWFKDGGDNILSISCSATKEEEQQSDRRKEPISR